MKRLKINRLNIALALGLAAIAGILTLQLFWVREAFNNEEKKFAQKAHITLLKVVEQLYRYSNNEFPLKNPINRVSNDYYIVNVNNDFESGVLEYCLRDEFQKANLLADFEYAIYKCQSDEMVYGNYVSFTNKETKKSSFHFPKQNNLVYYFAIRFPGQTGYLVASLKYWWLLSLVLVLILLIYVYSVFTILQQKKYSALQRDFINNMTHEFKTPLSSILIASDYLAKQESIKQNEKLLKYAHIILEQGTKLNNHVSKVLNIARSDDHPLELNLQKINLAETIHKAAETIRLKHPDLIIRLQDDQKSLNILADEFHFTNVVYNLLDNSVKYGTHQPCVTVNISQQASTTHLSFCDNGPGVPAPNLPHIFEKFYRGQSANSSVNGFGLGLYYVKKIAALHQWKIQARANVPAGLCIMFIIPEAV